MKRTSQVRLFELEEHPAITAPNISLDSSLKVSSLNELRDPEQVLARLRAINWDFSKENTSYFSHDIHPYPAKFIPHIPRNLIHCLSLSGELVWDPFGGSGTTALEALLLNRRVLSTDANPLGALIGKAKTTVLTREDEWQLNEWSEKLKIMATDLVSLKATLLANIQVLRPFIPDIPNIKDWFEDNAIKELAYLKLRITDLAAENQMIIALIAFSRTILKASNQDEETRYSRRTKNIKVGETLLFYTRDLKYCIQKSKQLENSIGFKRSEFATVDLRKPINDAGLSKTIPENSVDLIVTSPPYPNVTDYHLYHRFRLFWLGYDPREFAKIEIGSHLRHQKEASGFDSYLDEMKLCLANLFSALRPGRYCVLVLGDAVFAGKTYDTAGNVGNVATGLGFEVVGIINRAVHRTKRSFMVAARRTREEQLLVLRKPISKARFELHSPSYKMWKYEQALQEREIESLLGAKTTRNLNGMLSVYSDSLFSEKMRSLAFTSAISSKTFSYEKTWQALLENSNSSGSSRKESNYLTHGIHGYKGKFYPQLAKSLINLANLPSKARLLDPFCGCGTLVLEGYLAGFESFGCDLNPLAVKISRAKVNILSVEPFIRDRLIAQFIESISKPISGAETEAWLLNYSETARHEIERWFPDKVRVKLAAIIDRISRVSHPVVQEFLEVVLSSIVRQISQQDPHDLRVRKRKNLLVDAPVIELILKSLIILREKLISFERIRNYVPSTLGTATLWEGDTRLVNSYKSSGLDASSIDAIITSPPYATALPYVDTDRLSLLLLLGMDSSLRRPLEDTLTGTREISLGNRNLFDALIDKGDFGILDSTVARGVISRIYKLNKEAKVGFRRKNQAALLYRYFSDMTISLQALDWLLKPSGRAFFILGDNTTTAGGIEVDIPTVEVIKEMGNLLRWKLKEEIPISVTVENYKHVKNAITSNSILWFEKSSHR